MSSRLRIARLLVHLVIGGFLVRLARTTFAHPATWPWWIRLAVALALLAWAVDLVRLAVDGWHARHDRRRRSPAPTPSGGR